MSTQRREKVRLAIDDIRGFYKTGKESLRARPERAEYARGAIEAEAEKLSINPDTLRKARQFADPETGYSSDEVQQLCKLIGEAQSGQEESKAIFGKTHIIRLMSVPNKKRRTKIQEQAIRENWSTKRLEAELKGRFGPRRSGGRRPQIPHDEKAFLTQLESMCEEWRRWRAELDRDMDVYPLHKLRKELQEKIFESSDRLEDLRMAVEKELNKLEPKRESRQIFTDGNGNPERRPSAAV